MPPRHGGPGGIRRHLTTSALGRRARDVFFLPERYPRSELGPIGVLAVRIDDSTARSELRDVVRAGTLIGASLLDTLMNIDHVLSLRELMARSGEEGTALRWA
jgi:hypothetical protein